MEFGQSTATLEMNIPKETQRSFKIEQNRKSFEILSKELYKDEIGSIIREICCNAYDSHIAAGKEDVPIVVTLPSLISDVFSVEDFGVGLAEEDVFDLYTTYFKSTKDTSNEFTGAFGLGSKTPFCYTDSFSIESSFNGVTKKYIVYVEPTDGIPAINKVLEEDTPNKSNGFKVSFSTKETDIGEFSKKAKEILCHFNVLPEVNGLDLKSHAKTFFLKFKNAKIFHYQYNVFPYAIMGNVAYKIDNSYLKDTDAESLINNACYLFNIGDLTVTTSRDSLRYDAKTIESLKKKIAATNKEIRADLKKKIEESPSIFEARKIYGLYTRGIIFEGYKSRIEGPYYRNNIIVQETIWTDVEDVGTIFVRYKNGRGYFNRKNDDAFKLEKETSHDHFIILDDNKHYLRKTAYLMREKKISRMYHLILKDDTPATLKKMLDYIGIDSCSKMSEVIIPAEKQEELDNALPVSINGKKSKRDKNTFSGTIIDAKNHDNDDYNINLENYSYYVLKSAAGCHINDRLIVKPKDISDSLKALGLEEEVLVILKNHTKTIKEAEKLGLKSLESLILEYLYHDAQCLVGTLVRNKDISRQVAEIMDTLRYLRMGKKKMLFEENIDPKILRFSNIISNIDSGPDNFKGYWYQNEGPKFIFTELIEANEKIKKRVKRFKKAINTLQGDIYLRYKEVFFLNIKDHHLKTDAEILSVIKLINYIGSRPV